jgi:hypothetical protein
MQYLEAISKIGFWSNPPEADKVRGGEAFSPLRGISHPI